MRCTLLHAFCCLHLVDNYFSYASPDKRDLHSSPTRRSSDLAQVAEHLRPRLRVHPRVRPPRQGCDHDRPCARDRKSTRLNSSHRCISYAVFCLKKKMLFTTAQKRTSDTKVPERRS